jgi:hypothetical protein
VSDSQTLYAGNNGWYDLVDRSPKGAENAKLYGAYERSQAGLDEKARYDLKTNPSGENAETLRQSVVNSYKSQIGSPTSSSSNNPVQNNSANQDPYVLCPAGTEKEEIPLYSRG